MARKAVNIDVTPLRRFGRRFESQLRSGTGPVGDMLKQWGERYLRMAAQRYDTLSRGGTSSVGQRRWPPLAESTKRSRRKRRRRSSARGRRRFAILKDTGTLRNALSSGGLGQVFRVGSGGVELGFSGMVHSQGASKRAGKRASSHATLGDLVRWHERGDGNLPRREILPAELDDRTTRGMQNDVKRAVVKLGRQVQG